jgi:hypothetical protein
MTATPGMATPTSAAAAFDVRLPPTPAASSGQRESEAARLVRIGLAALAVAGLLIAVLGWFYRRMDDGEEP